MLQDSPTGITKARVRGVMARTGRRGYRRGGGPGTTPWSVELLLSF